MLSDPGDYIGLNQPRFYYPGNGSVKITGNAGYLTVHTSGGTLGDAFDMDFAAPPGESLHPGFYDHAERAAFREAGRPGIDIFGDGRGCNEIAGRFDVKDMKVGSGGSVTRLWVTYEQHCEGGLPALFGEVQFKEPVAPTSLLVAPGSLWWPDVDPLGRGTSVPATVVDTGGSDVSVSDIHVVGLHAADFQIRLDQCTGVILSPGGSCQVFLRFVPTGVGPRVAAMEMTDGGGVTHLVALDGLVIPGVTKLVMNSDPGDYIGQGLHYSYTSANAAIDANGTQSVVHASVEGPRGRYWTLDFAAPQGDILAPGTYTRAARYPFQGSAPGMDISGNGRGCNTLIGRFKVTSILVDAFGTLRYFGVKYRQHCEEATPALRGTLNFHAPRGDTTPPGKVMNLSVVRSGHQARITWTTPGDSDLGYIVVRYLQADVAPGAPNGSLLGYAGTGTSATIKGLSLTQPLTLAVYAVDTSGNVSPSVIGMAGPLS